MDTCKIIPIYKNKGNNTDPSIYEPITLINCLGKSFTFILNENMCRKHISENQAGLRKDYSTVDHIFCWYTL